VHGLFNALFAPLYSGSVVEFIPKFSVSGIWQRWRESYPNDASKNDEAITVFTGVPTMYTRLLQGYDNMDPDQQSACSYAAKQLRLMVSSSCSLKLSLQFGFISLTLFLKPHSYLLCTKLLKSVNV
jgi:malonyl-CoA/methylmalonyl-CoA synthetase